jgi:hypothetical protein
MKKLIINSILFTMMVIGMLSCKKQNLLNSGTGKYIEFKIDGQQYRLEEKQISSTDFTVATAHHSGPTSGKYFFSIAVAHSPGDEGAWIVITDAEPITKTDYTLNVAHGDNISYVMPDGRQYLSTSSSVATVHFSSISTAMGDPVEANFQVSNMQLFDEDGDLVSSGHTLTDGHAKMSIN